MNAESRFAIALAGLKGVGRRRLRGLIARRSGRLPQSVDELVDFVRLSAATLRIPVPGHDEAARAWDEAQRLVETCARRDWRVVVLGGQGYPAGLLRLDDPPAVLFVHGGSVDAVVPRVAIVGTREPTEWGLARARDAARSAVEAGIVVVSGLAWGIDTAAHEATVKAGGVTWATLPAGLDRIYPPSNRVLAERIVASGGALLTEYLPGARPHPTFFVERDRLQAALSVAVVVIETGLTGGTLHTVRFARALGVPVWATLPEESPDGESTWPDAQLGTAALVAEGVPRIEARGVGLRIRALDDDGACARGPDQPTLF